MKAKEKAKGIAYAVLTLMPIWIVWSYIDVIAHNMTTHVYSKLNFFVILLNMAN